MSRRVLCVLMGVAVIVLGVTTAVPAGPLSYTEDFSTAGSATATNYAGAGTIPNYPGWNFTGYYDGLGTATAGGGQLVLGSTANQDTLAGVSASQITGGASSSFDVSQYPLTVSAGFKLDSSGEYAIMGVYGGPRYGNMEVFRTRIEQGSSGSSNLMIYTGGFVYVLPKFRYRFEHAVHGDLDDIGFRMQTPIALAGRSPMAPTR